MKTNRISAVQNAGHRTGPGAREARRATMPAASFRDRRGRPDTGGDPTGKSRVEKVLMAILRSAPCVINGQVHVGDPIHTPAGSAMLFARSAIVDGDPFVLDVRLMGLEALEWEIERGRVHLLDEIAG